MFLLLGKLIRDISAMRKMLRPTPIKHPTASRLCGSPELLVAPATPPTPFVRVQDGGSAGEPGHVVRHCDRCAGGSGGLCCTAGPY